MATEIIPLAYKMEALTVEVQERSIGYLTTCQDSYVDEVNPRLDVQLPTLEGLAEHLNVPRSAIDRWRKDYPQFNAVCERVLNAQAVKLINGGLSGAYNPTITKVLLSKHGYIEKVEQPDKPTTINVLIQDYKSKLTEVEAVNVLSE